MKFTVPIPEKISLNKIYAGVHWTVRSRHKDAFRGAVMASKPKKYTGLFPVIIYYHFRLQGKLLDSTNLSYMAKLVEDGLVHNGVIPDDSQKYVKSFMPTTEKIGKGEYDEVDIEIKTPQ